MGKMGCRILEWDDTITCKYVVVLSRYQGKLLFSRHRERSTWETQGGHIEPGETPQVAARRELWEESGAARFTLRPLCIYYAWVTADPGDAAYGAAFVADIEELGPLPESEMAQVRVFETLPEDLTYPDITPRLYQEARKRSMV